jgi:hypothetical protein
VRRNRNETAMMPTANDRHAPDDGAALEDAHERSA